MSPQKTIQASENPMAPVKIKVEAMLRALEPIKFPVDEPGEHVRDHWTLPTIYIDGIFKSVECKDAGLRVALNLAECFKLGSVEWSGET